jgi:hypothetical protein
VVQVGKPNVESAPTSRRDDDPRQLAAKLLRQTERRFAATEAAIARSDLDLERSHALLARRHHSRNPKAGDELNVD